MENQRQIIINQLKAIQNRARNQAILRNVTICLFFEFSILAVLYIAIRLFSFPFAMLHITISAVGIAVILGVCLGLRHREKLTEIATLVDDNMQLKGRVNTSLEVIRKNQKGEIVDLQIGDSAEAIANLDLTKTVSYVMPPLLKWISIPIFIMALSFAVPRQYEGQRPSTAAEQNAIDMTIAKLTRQSVSIDDSKIRDDISRTIEKLKKVTHADAAHEHLHTLNSKVRKYASEGPDETAIAQATRTAQHFQGMDSTALADELNKLSEQSELTPELQDQLTKLFAKLSEHIPQGKLRQTFDQIQGQTVSPNTLQEIADALQQANQLKLLEEQLIDSRKDIALASIETEQLSNGIAGSGGVPGQESGNKETQGTQVVENTSDFSPTKKDIPLSTNNNIKPLTGDEAPSIQISGNELTIHPEDSLGAPSITRVFTGRTAHRGTEPDYLPFSDVVLSAQREYALAIENNRIPVRYRSQIKAYLEAIAKVDEK